MDTLAVRCVSLLTALLIAIPAASQETGEITGTVIDASCAVLPGATVTVSGPVLLQPQTAITSETENKVVLIDPSGQIIVSHLKSHAVAGWEAGIMRPGDGRLPVVATRAGRMVSQTTPCRTSNRAAGIRFHGSAAGFTAAI